MARGNETVPVLDAGAVPEVEYRMLARCMLGAAGNMIDRKTGKFADDDRQADFEAWQRDMDARKNRNGKSREAD